MKKYTIILRSDVGMISLWLLFFAIIIAVTILFPDLHKTTGFTIPITLLIAGVFLNQKLTIAKTEWTITKEGVALKWVTQLNFQKESDLFLKWEEIKSYKDVYGRAYNIFVIKLVNGERLRFPHGSLFRKDEFNEFLEDFYVMFLTIKHPEQLPIGYKLKKTKI